MRHPRAQRLTRLCLRTICVVALLGLPHRLQAQAVLNRGVVEGTVFVFPLEAEQDPTQIVGDLLARDEVSLRRARWFLAAAGVELRANTHSQVEDSWALDFFDSGIQRPHLSIRRLAAT